MARKRRILAVLALLTAGTAEASANYQITNLGTGFAPFQSLSDSGQAVLVRAQSDGTLQSFLVSGGSTTPIVGPGGAPGYLDAAPNRNGLAFGYYLSGGEHIAALWNNGQMFAYQLPKGMDTPGPINGQGDILGAVESNGLIQAVMDSGGKITKLGTFGGDAFQAGQLNDKDQIATTVYTRETSSGPVTAHAIFYSGGNSTDIGTLGGLDSFETSLNDSGTVVGASEISGVIEHGFVWQDGTMKDVGVLPGDQWSQLVAINGSGTAIGESGVGTATSQPVLWTGTKLLDLSSLVTQDEGWELQSVSAINDNGQIVGSGIYDGNESAFLLTPASVSAPEMTASPIAEVAQVSVPEPAGSLLLFAGASLLMRARRGRHK